MKVTTTTWPRSWGRLRRLPFCVVSVKLGAGPILDSRCWFVAGCAMAGGAATTTVSASRAAVMNRFTAVSRRGARTDVRARAPSLAFQLLFELVQKAPVGALGDDLLRRRLDHADLVEPERVEADGVLGIIVAPAVIG